MKSTGRNSYRLARRAFFIGVACCFESFFGSIAGWLKTQEQSLAIWLEGLALVAIFGLELKEYWRQGADRIEQHQETLTQLGIMRDHSIAAKDAAEAAKANAEAARLGRVAHTSGLRVELLTLVPLFVSHPQKPFTRPNNRSTLIFDRSLQNT